MRTAESVSPKHPDKVCDIISDSILDELLINDKDSRVAIETMGGHNEIKITGEVTSKSKVDYKKIIKNVVGDGYKIDVNVVEQSPEISKGVDSGGAGDQGIMIGYACDKNIDKIPHELFLARNLCKYVYAHNKNDGKTQITLNDNDEISVLVCSFCGIESSELKILVNEWIKYEQITDDFKMYINPAGEWSVGGFDADAGVTGRKLIVDNYGPQVNIGGGAFSGKDISKVDRSGAYVARKIAVDLLKEHNAEEVIVKLAYSIGVVEPVMKTALIDGKNFNITNKVSVENIKKSINFDNIKFKDTAEWGAFGNNFEWDK